MKDHRLIDERSLAFHSLIAEKLRVAPVLVGHAQENIIRWQRDCSERARPTLLEWQALLEGPLDDLLSVLTSPDERATRLRQSSPFAGLLSSKERMTIIREFQARDANAA